MITLGKRPTATKNLSAHIKKKKGGGKKQNKKNQPYLILPFQVFMDSSHVVLHAGLCDKGLSASIKQTPAEQSRFRLKKLHFYNFKYSYGGLLVWFLPTMTQFMFCKLIASAEALVAVCTGKWFLTWRKHKLNNIYWPLIVIHTHPAVLITFQLSAYVLLNFQCL